MEPLPGVFDMLQYFEMILPFKWKAFDVFLQDERYILWVVALLEACDVNNNGRHLGFYQELEIRGQFNKTSTSVIYKCCSSKQWLQL